jgi:hypothetical protein
LWDSTESRDADREPHEIIRYAGDLIEVGIDTDKKLLEAEERAEWGNNAWFDLYAYGEGVGDTWLNCVHHDIVEAVEQAKGLINDDEVWNELEVK